MKLKLIFLSVFLFGIIKTSGQAPSTPLTKCWEFNSAQMSNKKVASDNDSKVIIPQNDSKIITLDTFGKILWTAEIGGNILSEILVSDGKIYLATQIENKEDSFFIRSISLETGLTIWEKKITTEKDVKQVEIITNNKDLLLVTDKETLYFINLDDGNIKSSLRTESGISTNIEMDEEAIYFVSLKNQLIKYSLNQKRNSSLFELKDKVGRIYLNNKGQILLADNLGRISQYNLTTEKKEWTFRTGGNINSISELQDTYILSSLDNYLYNLTVKKGKLVWRKRMEGRTEGVLANNQSQFISSLINGQVTLFSELKKGKTINQISLSDQTFFINQPIYIGKLLILSTSLGIVAYSSNGC